MRRLFDCFRSRDKEATCNSLSKPSPVKPSRSYDSKNRLSTLFLSEETASSHCHDREGSGLDSMHIDKNLNDEAHFPKATNTVPTTPTEISKVSKELEPSPLGKHFGSPESHFCISSNSDAMLQLGEKIDESSEEMGRSLVTSEQTPSSCLTHARYSARISFGSSDAGEETEESVGTAFRDEVDRTRKVPPKAANMTRETKSVQSEFDFDQSYSSTSSTKSSSRKPEMAGKTLGTPLKLADEIQTAGKTVVNGDRPIIGMVAAHWNEKEQTQISPKWWDGNGIPNSTNKYKEDQKVSWHATPFEERLEKALSEEAGQGFIPPRKLGIVEESERDTAVSHLQLSTQSMSVMSF